MAAGPALELMRWLSAPSSPPRTRSAGQRPRRVRGVEGWRQVREPSDRRPMRQPYLPLLPVARDVASLVRRSHTRCNRTAQGTSVAAPAKGTQAPHLVRTNRPIPDENDGEV